MQSLRPEKINHCLLRLLVICIALICSACTNTIIREGTASAESDKECRAELAKGTKVRRSICLSSEEWATLDARAEELADQQERDLNTFFRRTYQKSGQGLGDIELDPDNNGL